VQDASSVDPAYFTPKKGSGVFKTFTYNPDTITHIDTLHEGVHLNQF
jgi:hypothetical protein